MVIDIECEVELGTSMSKGQMRSHLKIYRDKDYLGWDGSRNLETGLQLAIEWFENDSKYV